MTDQQRADHLSCAGHPLLRTPHIDAIAARGVMLDRFCAATPICMPNRASLMTGRHASAHGVRHNGIPLPLESTTFADLLRHAGYRTVLVGKSHLQNMTGRPPLVKRADDTRAPPPDTLKEARRGPAAGRYDQQLIGKWRDDPAHDVDLPFYGFDAVDLTVDHGDEAEGHYTRWLRARHPDPDSLRGERNALPSPGYAAPQAWRTALPEELYPTSYVAERALARLDELARAPEQPFFLKCSFPDPHHPFTPPGRYWGLYDPAAIALPPSWHLDRAGAPPHVRWFLDERDAGRAVKHTPAMFACTEREMREATALSFGMIAMVDDAVGRILARLEALGLARSTVVIFTSDHGEFLGDHQLMLKGPIHYQSVIRVVFI